MKKNKGFSLIEMLVVIAIISVLVSIVIPVVANKLEATRETTDIANVRSAYAEVMISANSGQESGSVKKTGETYFTEVNLVQTQEGWEPTTELNVGGVVPDDGYWLNSPGKGGVCLVSYTTNDAKPTINWAGSFYDYLSPLKTASVKLNNKSNILNANNSGNGTISKLLGNVTDSRTLEDMKTWAAVRDPKDGTDTSAYNYIMSGVDINDSSVKIGDKIPAMYIDKNGNYSVGFATVTKAPDGGYKIITMYNENGANKYACDNSTHDRPEYDASYDSSKLLDADTKKDYGTFSVAAQTEYERLLAEYYSHIS